MDGVLIDSLDSWWISLNSSLRTFGYKEISKEEFIERYWGYDLSYNLKKMGLNLGVVTFCNNVYSEQIGEIRIYPDTKYTLQKLNRYKKGIITNTPKDCAYQIVKKFDIEQYFDAIVTSDEVSKGKPDPSIIFKACKILDVDPKTVVLVGDTKNDVKAGKAANCKVFGINIDADFKIQRLSELTEFLTL
jgi:HAD superfamily hydrolase (TIGR01509 family)